MPLWKIAHLDQGWGDDVEAVGRCGDDAIVRLLSSLIVKG